MGISFKVSKTGRRFRPAPSSAAVSHAEDEESIDASIAASKTQNDAVSLSTRKQGEATENKGFTKIGDNEVSFTLKLFPDGYLIGKPVENESGNQTSIDVPKFLHPYDRASEALFSAIESGRLPGDILDDLPCKYIDGTLICEVRDYRKCFPEGVNVPSAGIAPITNRVSLKMSLENIIKDIPAISENGWTYGDLMEVESRILKAIQPQLCLDPTPQLERLSINPVQNKLNLELRSMRRKRLRQIPEVVVSSNNNHGKKVYLDRVPESSRLGDTGGLVQQQPSYDNNNVSNPMLQTRSSSFGSDGSLLPSPIAYPQSKYTGVASPRMIKGSPGGQDMMIPFADNITANIHGKRENQDGQSSPLSKKARISHPGVEGNMQHLGQQIDASELQWKQTLLQQQSSGRGIQYSGSGMQKFPTQVFEGEGQMSFAAQQQGMRYNLKEEPVETDQQRMPHQMMRSNFPHSPWSNLDSNPRKLVASPHVSSGLPQSPLSSKSGEFSSGSIGHQFGAAVTKDKPAVSSVNPSSANDSMHRQNQALSAAKRRSNSLPKAPPISGVGSPASVGNMSQPLGDQTTLERFSKIEIVAMRFQLNCKKNKVDEYPMRKNNAYSAQQLMTLLANDSNNENPKDETRKMPLSKSLVGGNMNVCKTRILNFIQTERILQGNSYQLVPKARTRMIMSEKPNDGAVAIHIGEIEDAEYLAAEEYLPTLPNTHMADLLAAQYSSLMTREGYHVEDLVQPKPSRTNSTQPNNTPPSSEMQQFSDGGVPLQQSNDAAKPVVSSQNMQGQRMLPPGNNQSMQMSGGLLLPGVSVNSRPQQTEQLPPQQQQQQFQRPPVMLPTNSMQHLNNMQMGGHMTNKPSPLQLQLMQQQQNQNQNQNQAAMQRKMMPGLGNVGMGNLGNNMVGLGGLGNVMGMGGGRGVGVGVSGISAPMGSISNMNQNAMNLSSTSNLSNAIRNLTPQQAAFMKMRMANQNRANILGNPQSGIGGIPGARQMHPNSGLSMLGPSLNRANMNPMQRTAMGPPKMLPGGMNLYTNQQQQLQQMQQMQQMQQQQQQMQQIQQQQQQPPHQQQQETTSPLQGVMSPPHQVGSPSSSMGGPHQMNQQQPLQQQQQMMQTQASPQQMSSMGGGNPVEAGPGSPQLSSQTMGSVGSIANSPMEMQGVNKSNSVNNA